jgi:hypothetical protein
LFNLAVDQIKAYEKMLEQLQGLYDRQKELTQEAIEELNRRRTGPLIGPLRTHQPHYRGGTLLPWFFCISY